MVQESDAIWRPRTPGQCPADTLTLGPGDERDAEEADERPDPDPNGPGLAPGPKAVEEQHPKGNGGHDEGGDAARDAALGPHHEAVADRKEQDAHESVVEPLAAAGPAVGAVGIERHERHHESRGCEPQGGRGQGRHLVNDDADGHVGRAPDDPDDEQGEPGQEALAFGHAR